MANKVVYKPSFPILGILGLIFITLKLCNVIAWSWWWVLAPFWIPFAVVIAMIGLVAVYVLIFEKLLGN